MIFSLAALVVRKNVQEYGGKVFFRDNCNTYVIGQSKIYDSSQVPKSCDFG